MGRGKTEKLELPTLVPDWTVEIDELDSDLYGDVGRHTIYTMPLALPKLLVLVQHGLNIGAEMVYI